MRVQPAALESIAQPRPSATALDVRAVSKSFAVDGATIAALRGVSLAVAAAEVVCVVGPSGCGKSTLLRVAGGLLAPSDGAVWVEGRAPSEAQALKRIGYVPQDAALLPWRTALGNVALALQLNPGPQDREQIEQRARAMLARVGLTEAEGRSPHQLSGGMRQRVALARALVFGPGLLLMDEPFAALDELSREAMRYELLAVWERERPAVVFVTHSVAESVTLADRVLVLSRGPAHVLGEVSVRLPRPRTPDLERSPAFRAAEDEIRALLRAS